MHHYLTDQELTLTLMVLTRVILSLIIWINSTADAILSLEHKWNVYVDMFKMETEIFYILSRGELTPALSY